MKEPLVSVIMSTYNTPHTWLKESIDSILNQTHRNFEFIIIDDCSTNMPSAVFEIYNDSRLHVFRNEINIGLTKSLNIALSYANGEYIARMDADDISLPGRLERQVKFMEKHSEIIACGTYRKGFGDITDLGKWDVPDTRQKQQIQLFFFNCGITHPTVLLRKDMIDKYRIKYNEEYKKAQDYGLWVSCTRYAKLAIIPEFLLYYRKHNGQISTAQRENQLFYDTMIKLDQLKNALEIQADDIEKSIHIDFCKGIVLSNPEEIEEWTKKLINANNKKGYFEKKMFCQEVERRWFNICYRYYHKEHDTTFAQAYRKAFNFKYYRQRIILDCKKNFARLLKKDY